jgi:hypothetical protein
MSEQSTTRYIWDEIKSGLVKIKNVSLYLLTTYSIVVVCVVAGGLAFMELFYIDTGMPEWLIPYYIPIGLTLYGLIPVTEIVRRYVGNPPKEHMHEVDPENGDAGFKQLYPRQWENLTVVDVVKADDDSLVEIEKERSDLHPITIDTKDGAVEGHECEFYDPDENKAYVSFFGSVSGTEIRRHRNSAEYLKHEASAEKDIHQRLRNLYPDLVEEAVHNRMNHYIHIVEGEQVPGKKSIRSIIDQGIKDSELQEYVEEDPDFSDMMDMENPFDGKSEAEMYRQMLEAKGDDDE